MRKERKKGKKGDWGLVCVWGGEKSKVRKARSPSNHDLAIEVVRVLPAGTKVLGSGATGVASTGRTSRHFYG